MKKILSKNDIPAGTRAIVVSGMLNDVWIQNRTTMVEKNKSKPAVVVPALTLWGGC